MWMCMQASTWYFQCVECGDVLCTLHITIDTIFSWCLHSFRRWYYYVQTFRVSNRYTYWCVLPFRFILFSSNTFQCSMCSVQLLYGMVLRCTEQSIVKGNYCITFDYIKLLLFFFSFHNWSIQKYAEVHSHSHMYLQCLFVDVDR